VRLDPVGCLRASWELAKPRYWLLLGVTVVGMLIGSMAPLGILMGPMMCGVYLCYLRLLRGEPTEFSHLFKGFDYFVQSLIATLVLVGISLVILVPFYVALFAVLFGTAALGRDGPAAGLLLMVPMLVLMLVVLGMSLLVGLLFAFAYPLIVDRGLSGVEALKTSARAVWANLGGVLGLLLLCALLGLCGLCACYVGTFFVMPITFGALTVAYRRIFPETETPASPAPA
jgi:uncharacterized membrane protein